MKDVMALVIREIANFCSLKDILHIILVCKDIYNEMKNYEIDLVNLHHWNVNLPLIIQHKYFDITGLYMRFFKMDDISILNRIISLKTIKLETSRVSKTEFLSTFSKLEHLSLIDTTIDNIEGLPPSLTYLNITSSRLEDIEPISQLINLRTLILNYNYIVSLKPLQNLQNLEVLYLISNNITSLEDIKDLKNIKNLSVDQNNITDLWPIFNFQNIILLSINETNITDLSVISKLTKLEHVSHKGFYSSNGSLSD